MPVLLTFRKLNKYYSALIRWPLIILVLIFRVYASHYGLPQEVLDELGILNTHVRLLPGLESINDLIADLEQALEKTYNQANE